MKFEIDPKTGMIMSELLPVFRSDGFYILSPHLKPIPLAISWDKNSCCEDDKATVEKLFEMMTPHLPTSQDLESILEAVKKTLKHQAK